jgi:hypothetical protein
MTHRNLGTVLRSAFSSALLLALAAEVPAAAWKQTEFLIGGWGGSPDYSRAPQPLLLLDQAGIDFLVDVYQWDLRHSERLVSTLDSLRRRRPDFGLQAVLSYSVPEEGEDPKKPPAWMRRRRAVEEVLVPGNRISGPSVLGWLVDDEPVDPAAMERAGNSLRKIRSRTWTENGLGLVNLYPVLVADGASRYRKAYGTDREKSYRKYLDSYFSLFAADSIPAPIVSFDDYPLQDPPHVRDEYFHTLRLVREHAARASRPGYGIPMWTIIQLSPFKPQGKPFHATPTMAQVRWQAWCAVAYGAKSISYWMACWGMNPGADEGYGEGVLNESGLPSSRYAGVQALNAELHALGPTLMGLEPIGVVHASLGGQTGVDDELVSSPRRAASLVATIQNRSGSSDCMVGVFRRAAGGDDYLLVVNKSLEASRSFGVELSRTVSFIERVRRSDGRSEHVATGTRVLEVRSLPPATGELFRIVR